MSSNAQIALVVSIAVLLAGCHESGVAVNSPSDEVQPVFEPAELPTTSYGAITALGLRVNDVLYFPGSATIAVDGAPIARPDVHVGDVVLLEGMTFSDAPSWGNADRIALDFVVQGAIEAVDSTSQSLVVLGQPVEVNADTVFDEAISGRSLSGLLLGDQIRVAGFRNSAGKISATRVARQSLAARFATRGVVVGLDVDTQRFNINGLTVDYSVASLETGDRGSLGDGDSVIVTGLGFASDDSLVAATVRRAASTLPGSAGDQAAVQGYVTAFGVSDPTHFEIAGLRVATTSATVYSGGNVGLDVRARAEGELDDSGVLIASRVQLEPGLVSAPPPPGSYTVSGRVFDAYLGPVPDAVVDLFVENPERRYAYSRWNGPLRTDDNGEFSVPNLPSSVVTVSVSRDDFVQQCGVAAPVNGDVSLDVELTSTATLAAPSPPLPQSYRNITLSGLVYEGLASDKQPIPDAVIRVDNDVEFTVATTRADQQGRFALCAVPWYSFITVTAPGFQPVRIDVDFDWLPQGLPFDILLERQ